MLSFFLTYFFRLASSNLVVNTTSGPVQGVPSLVQDVEAFLGIPYAEPPVGDLRFSRPVPKKSWTDAYDASILPPPCSQLNLESYYFMPDITNMSEDCLYLNIWAPKYESTRGLRPIIVYIHPGAFITGSSNLKAHDGSHLASRGDLVVVTFNYRLGTLGFFLSYTEEANGNMGMYDQVMAIKWVKENAEQFGGDPENIVLMGVSAGAYSVSAHMISPLTKNLFKKAIIQSRYVVHKHSVNNTKLYENSQTVASMVGCTNETTTLKTDSKSVVNCLKSKSIEDIVAAEKTLFKYNPDLFFPRVEDEFLPKTPEKHFLEGKFRKDVDIMIGITKEEGLLFLIVGLEEYTGHYGHKVSSLSKHLANAISRSVLMRLGEPDSGKIIRHYMNRVKNRTNIEYSKKLVDIIGDYLISCNSVFLADFLSAKGRPVYFYKFDFRPSSSPMPGWVGATHLDDLQYVFGNPFHENFTEEEIELSNNLIDRWSAFARTGNPNIQDHLPWPRFSYENPLYLDFGQEGESIKRKPLERCEIWRERHNAQFDSELIRVLKNSLVNVTNSDGSKNKFMT